MYELVNTSLPNGLIAGTHGFATVAMTKGVPDILRGRLEALCAYTHRTSVHDGTYYQQNPVNWFHVTLPQGEHVVGRVAPSDFDYTGRTNRLARLRVFGSTEMPEIGGAEVLSKEKHWFSQLWQGNPKWLDEDRRTCGLLRMANPVRVSSAPTWDSIFGVNGSRMAQKVAWQLERNLSAGGKAVYFKTSTTWDVSGEKLLGLFVDVINLMPVEMRACITFSTYPVSLPGGTGCNLCGVYDRDRFFDATSATQAWIDCENARIVHEELLPSSSPSSNNKAKPAHTIQTPNVNMSVTNRGASDDASRLGVRHGPVSVGDPNSYRNLIAPKKKGPDMFVVGFAVASLVVFLAAVGFFFWMTQRNKQQMQESGAAAAVEATQLENLKNVKEQERIAREQEEAKRKQEEEHAQRERTEKEKAEPEKKSAQEAEDKKREQEKISAEKIAKEKVALDATKTSKKGDNRKKHKPEFMVAHVVGRGTPPKPPVGLLNTNKGETFTVYYYIDGGMTITNEVSGFKPIISPTDRKKIIDYSLYVREPKLKLKLLDKSPLVLWVIKDKVWFDWKQPKTKRSSWFEDADNHDIQIEMFGCQDEVFETWNKEFQVEYIITWGDADGQSMEWSSRKFSITNATEAICREEIEPLNSKIDKTQDNYNTKCADISRLTNEISELNKQISQYAVLTNQLAGLEKEYEEAKKKKEKENEKKANVVKKKNEIADFNKKHPNLELAKKTKTENLQQLESSAKRAGKKLESLKKEYDQAVNDPDRIKRVRKTSFDVTIKGIN